MISLPVQVLVPVAPQWCLLCGSEVPRDVQQRVA
jgi:hypothetical protein